MIRLYDWLCSKCNTRRESYIDVPHGTDPIGTKALLCDSCDSIVSHARTISLVAPYTGDHVRNPHVYGGNMDTMGMRPVQALPDLAGAEGHGEETARKLAALPDSAPNEERYSILRDRGKSAPSGADYASLFETSEYKACEKKRAHEQRLNGRKRKRAKALKSGAHVNFRRDRCEGDPAI